MNKSFSFLLFTGLLLFSYSCRKSSTKSTKELLTISGWKYANFERRVVVDRVPSAWISSMASWDSCIKDNITLFKSDGSYEENEGPTKCGVVFPNVFGTGNWSLMSNDTQLKLTISHIGMLVSNYYDITVLDKKHYN